MTDKAFFGFKEIPASQKKHNVGQVFSSVASKYDVMNDVMSGGLHRWWKNQFVQMIPKGNHKLIDVAAGTGDIALKCLEQARISEATLCDINYDMLKQGKDKVLNTRNTKGISWRCCDAEALPFEGNQFDYYTIAFGIRNVTDIDQALREAHRVLKPGGRFLCLEFSKVVNPQLAKCYDAYSFKVIPKMGKLVANDYDSYQYLVESIRKFPDQKQFASKITNAGFENVTYKNMTGGVVAIHSGWKI